MKVCGTLIALFLSMQMRHLFFILPIFLSFFTVIIAHGTAADFKFEITDYDAMNLFEDSTEDFFCELIINTKKTYVSSNNSLNKGSHYQIDIKNLPFKNVETPPPEYLSY